MKRLTLPALQAYKRASRPRCVRGRLTFLEEFAPTDKAHRQVKGRYNHVRCHQNGRKTI